MEGVVYGVVRLSSTVLKDRGLTIMLASDEEKYVQASIHVGEKNLTLGGLLARVELFGLFSRPL